MKKSKRPKYRFILYSTNIETNVMKVYLRDIFLYNHTYYEYTTLGLRVYQLEQGYRLAKVSVKYSAFISLCINILAESKTWRIFHSYRKYKQFINNI